MRTTIVVLSLSITLFAAAISGQPAAERMEWFQHDKFGMFIHWGPYSNLAGEWKGQQVEVGENAEWIMHHFQIPKAEYQEAARRFNPVKFDAERWAELAANAGMKYLVITAKHHDGFAMYRSKVSNYNIADWTEFGRDPLKELAAACRKRGIRFCVYYSHREDWNEPGAYGNTWEHTLRMDEFEKYLEAKAKPQLRELLTAYGPIGLVWFDRGLYTPEQAQDFVSLVRGLQPQCIVNGRVGNYGQELQGDYQNMSDNGMPPGGVEEYWETPQTLNETWGFSRFDHEWKSPRTVIRRLVEIVSKGGNYLLNIGPRGDGTIPEPSAAVLERVGAWMRWHSESIYGAAACPLPDQNWGRCTVKDERIYLHVFDWPEDGSIQVTGLLNQPRKAYPLLDPGNSLQTAGTAGSIEVQLPGKPLDDDNTVIVLETGGPIRVDPAVVEASGGGFALDYLTAITNGKTVKRYNRAGQFHISKWTAPEDSAEWLVDVAAPGSYDVSIEYAALERWAGRAFTVRIGNTSLRGEVAATGGWYEYKRFQLGSLRLPTAGTHRVTVRPADVSEQYLMYLKGLKLTPTPK